MAATPTQDVQRIMESAQRLGVELDEDGALQWLTAMAAHTSDDDVVMDIDAGVYGHRVSMLDFSDTQLAHYRRVGAIVEFEDIPGKVETALALSGSAAQSKIQTYPGDADFFERVNIIAPTKEQACQILGKVMKDKAVSTLRSDCYQFIEAKLGSYLVDVVKDGRTCSAGSPIAWTAAEVQAGKIEAFTPEGKAITILWEEAAQDPGWCKLDWVIADPERGQLANASNMLDVTWEAPDGTITPLDGYLDPYFQEVYLQAESVPIFSKLVKHVSEDALEDYVQQLEKEVSKYVAYDPLNYGKAAKRMYNIFRLTGQYEAAAYLRELFDEPTTMLYQVHALIRTIDDVDNIDTSIEHKTILAQCDSLILSVIEALEGEQETEIVRYLLRLRSALSDHVPGDNLSATAEAARSEVINLVNNFFYEKLTGFPTIKSFLEERGAHL